MRLIRHPRFKVWLPLGVAALVVVGVVVRVGAGASGHPAAPAHAVARSPSPVATPIGSGTSAPVADTAAPAPPVATQAPSAPDSRPTQLPDPVGRGTAGLPPGEGPCTPLRPGACPPREALKLTGTSNRSVDLPLSSQASAFKVVWDMTGTENSIALHDLPERQGTVAVMKSATPSKGEAQYPAAAYSLEVAATGPWTVTVIELFY